MNSRDLVRRALAHEETPRAPYLIRLTGDMHEKLLRERGIENREAWLDNDVYCIAPPWWRWHELGADWGGPDVPQSAPRVRGGGSYESFFETVERARDETGKYLLVLIYGSHFEKAYFARGIENFLADIAEEFDFARRLCARVIEKNLVMLENILACDAVDGVLLGSDWGSQRAPLIDPNVWDELIRPGEQREYDLIRGYGKDVWIHSCGCITALVPRLVEMGVDVLNPVQPECMDIAELKRDHGGALTFWGGIGTQQILPFGTPEEVRAETVRVRDLLGKGGGYILSPAQDVQGDIPIENLEALLAVAREEFR